MPSQHSPGTLYLVGTPIGNLEDMSPRAVRILGEVALVAAEDTRRALKLLNHFGIKRRLVSYHRHNERERLAEILSLLHAGESVALVTDAGTPGISDPGEILAAAAAADGLTVTAIPGPSACLLALTCSGLPSAGFRFAGFLPRQAKERREALRRLAEEEDTFVLYEAPHRLLRTLEDLRTALGGDRKTAVARELTKVHEEIWRGDLDGALARYADGQIRGEFTLVVAGKRRMEGAGRPRLEEGLREMQRLVREGSSPGEAARRVADATGLARNALYRLYQLYQKGEE